MLTQFFSARPARGRPAGILEKNASGEEKSKSNHGDEEATGTREVGGHVVHTRSLPSRALHSGEGLESQSGLDCRALGVVGELRALGWRQKKESVSRYWVLVLTGGGECGRTAAQKRRPKWGLL